jgi:DNA-binding response OmpR family regulator
MTTVHDSDRSRLPGLLIVDPDPQLRDALARGMEGRGWQVWVATDGHAAIETYQQYRDRIDAALVDLQLPGLQGARILAELDRLNPALTRCAMSAEVTPYTACAFRRLSDTPLFTKPLNVQALSFALHELVASAVRQ